MTRPILTIFPGAFGKRPLLITIITPRMRIFCQEYSRAHRRHVDDDPIRPLNGPGHSDRRFEVLRSHFRYSRSRSAGDVLSDVLTRGGLTSRARFARRIGGYGTTEDGGIGMAKTATNPALLRVAVRREEGGQVESWVSESVGGAEHA